MKRIGLAVACVVHVLLAGLYLVRTPVFEAPDELPTYARAIELATPGTRLPDAERREGLLTPLLLAGLLHATGSADTLPRAVRDGVPRDGALRFRHGFDEAGPVSREVRTFRGLRLFALLCGLATLVLTHAIARRLFPASPGLASAAALCVACLPQWSFTHAVLGPVPLASVLVHAVVLELVTAVRAGALRPAAALRTGVCTGLALLATRACLPLVALVAVIGVLLGLRRPRGGTLSATALALAVALATGGFWQLMPDAEATRPESGAPPLAWLDLAISFVGAFGCGRVTVPPALAFVAWGAIVASLVGVAKAWRSHAAQAGTRLDVACLLLAITSTLGAARLLAPAGHATSPAHLVLAGGPMLILFCFGLRALGAPAWSALAAPLSAAGVLAFAFWPHFGLARERLDNGYEAVLHGGIREAGTPSPNLVLLDPPEAARCDEPPSLRFQAAASATPGAGYTLHLTDAAGAILYASYETTGSSLAGEGSLPAALWRSLPIGQPLAWRVRKIPNRAHGEDARTMPTSAWRTFVRAR